MPAPSQQIRFCTSADGVRIAYATSGSGPPLVKVGTWMTHVELDWESSVWRPWLRELSRDHRFLRYDARGCGLSDREVPELSLEAWVRDLETVVDAAGIERFPLLGLSEGGAIAIAYAARHPGRVSHLILHSAYMAAEQRISQPRMDSIAARELQDRERCRNIGLSRSRRLRHVRKCVQERRGARPWCGNAAGRHACPLARRSAASDRRAGCVGDS